MDEYTNFTVTLLVDKNSTKMEDYNICVPLTYRDGLETLEPGKELTWLEARYIEKCKTRVKYDEFSEEKKVYALRVIKATVDIRLYMYVYRFHRSFDRDGKCIKLDYEILKRTLNQLYALRHMRHASGMISRRVLEALKDDPNFVTPPGPHGSIKTTIEVTSFVDIYKNWNYYLGLMIRYITFDINNEYFGDRELEVTARGDGDIIGGMLGFNVRIN